MASGTWSPWNGWTATIEAPSGDLEIGADTDYVIDEWTGLDLPDMKVSELDLPEQHGGWSRAAYHQARSVVATGRCVYGVLWEQENALKLVMGAREATYPVVLHRPDADDVYFTASPRGLSLAHDRADLKFGFFRFQLQWQADDPRLYATSDEGGTLDAAAAGDGLTYPLAYPLDYGAGDPGSTFEFTNRGTAPTPLVATFEGPPSGSVTQMTLQNTTTGESLVLDYTLEPGHTLVVDTAAKTVLLDGSSTRFAAKQPGSTWLELPPGDSTLAYLAQGSSGSSVTVAVRSAWW
jgi:hypothetical protein